jgi:GNAT superfamily N-acetyltransferase
MDIETRLVENGDYADWAALWHDYLAFYKTARPEEVFRESWSRILDPDEAMYSALAFHDGRAIGLVNFLYHRSFWNITDHCYLNDLYVDPEQRGGGAGAKLIAFTQAHAEAQNATQLYWLTAQDNAPARKLYDQVATLTPFIKYACP